MFWRGVLTAVAVLLATAGQTSAHWQTGDPAKWIRLPVVDTTAVAVNAVYEHYAADDFLCAEEGPITDIHLWVSWEDDVLPASGIGTSIIILRIAENTPAAESPTGFSIPGDELWYKEFMPAEYTVQAWPDSASGAWIDSPDSLRAQDPQDCWQYNFSVASEEAFYGLGTPQYPVVYWLSVTILAFDPSATPGWRSTDTHWKGSALWSEGPGEEWEQLAYPAGHPLEGQPIDLAFVVAGDLPTDFDWGDVLGISNPQPPYPTLSADNGAHHALRSDIYMGARVDAEPDGVPNWNAFGDDLSGSDDEDGILLPTVLSAGRISGAKVLLDTENVPFGIVDGWIDFGADGSWDDPFDRVIDSHIVAADTTTILFSIPSWALPGAFTYGRFRISPTGGLTSVGPGGFGEVEDYGFFLSSDDYFKFVQFPNEENTGIDVQDSDPYILADDFVCVQAGPIPFIQLWGSWIDDYYPFGNNPGAVTFTLSIMSNLVLQEEPYYEALPDTVLWSHTFLSGEFSALPWKGGLVEGFLEPDGAVYTPNGDSEIWWYIFQIDEEDQFWQEGTPEDTVVYWLKVEAEEEDPAAVFGWKTYAPIGQPTPVVGSAAVWRDVMWPTPTSWEWLYYPPSHPYAGGPIHLAFGIGGETADEVDWGDAPDPSYPTLAWSNGASHTIVPDVYLGAGVDPDDDGQPDADSTGDDLDGTDDEDGVVFLTPLVPGETATFEVTTSTAGTLDVFIDWQADGDWDDPGDHVSTYGLLSGGTHQIHLSVPGDARIGSTFSRFRFTTYSSLGPSGPASDGEVEDHAVMVVYDEDCKYVQYPDLETTGMDVSTLAGWEQGIILADDFTCVTPGRLTQFRVWASWLGDESAGQEDLQAMLNVCERIDGPGGFPIPGAILWQQYFPAGTFQTEIWADGLAEGWLDPPDAYTWPADSECWLYTFDISPESAFHQTGMPDDPVTYMFVVSFYVPLATDPMGWKTAVTQQGDPAIFLPSLVSEWQQLVYPPGHALAPGPLDLAFGISTSFGTDIPDADPTPGAFGLGQNSPNPFNPRTTITYEVPSGGGHVRLEVFDSAGRHVRTLVDERDKPGVKAVDWDGTDDEGNRLATGVYFYSIEAGDYKEHRKMVLLR